MLSCAPAKITTAVHELASTLAIAQGLSTISITALNTEPAISSAPPSSTLSLFQHHQQHQYQHQHQL